MKDAQHDLWLVLLGFWEPKLQSEKLGTGHKSKHTGCEYAIPEHSSKLQHELEELDALLYPDHGLDPNL